MNPRLNVCVILLLAAAGTVINTEEYDFNDDFDDDFEGEFGRGRKGFLCRKMGSICFNATHFNVSEIVKNQGYCDFFKGGPEAYGLHHRHICPHNHPYCCVNCESADQDRFCMKKLKAGSVPRRECCLGELYFGQARLGCKCCKKCKRRMRCRNRHGFCVNAVDPVYNIAACLAGFPNTTHEGEYRIKRRGCVGIGCHCCEPVHPITSTEPSTDGSG